MTKGLKTVIVVIAILIMIPVLKVAYYFVFVYYSESRKAQLCNELNNDTEYIEVISEEIKGVIINKSFILDDPQFIELFKSQLQSVCPTKFDKYLFARGSNTILNCQIYGPEQVIYFQVVQFESGRSFLEFHRGGLFSLIGGIPDNLGLADLIINEVQKELVDDK